MSFCMWDVFVKSSSHSGKHGPLLCTFTVLQLKADTLPQPSTPCYYCDISNLSWPMTGLMIVFPVLFQPQITANSVIRGLLCQPSSGPLTVCWPGAVFPELRSLEFGSTTNSLQNSLEDCHCHWRPSVVTLKPWFLILSLSCFIASFTNFCQDCLSLRSTQNRWLSPFSTSTAGHLTLEPGLIVLTWSSSTALLKSKGSVFTLTASFWARCVWQPAYSTFQPIRLHIQDKLKVFMKKIMN